MKSAEEIMEILEAFDLTGSYRDAAELVGCSHHAVARCVAARDAGRSVDQPVARPRLIEEFLPKLEEWMEHSKGKVRADVAHEKLLALGYAGSERTTRRAVAQVRTAYRVGRVRVHRPWVSEPGMWLQAACDAFCEQVNGRVHRVTRRAPVEMLAEERARLHRLPEAPHTVAFGVTRTVPDRTPMITFDGGQYSVPHILLGQQVWVRTHGLGADEQVIIVHVGQAGPIEVARHLRATPGSPKIDDTHFPPAPAGALDRQPRPRTAPERDFLALGDGARLWVTEAAAAGTSRMRVKMAAAVATAKLLGTEEVDRALGHAALNGRFGEHDLASILEYQAITRPGQTHRAGEDRSLTQGTGGWAALGVSDGEVTP